MADVRPLRGVRFNPERLSNLGRVIAPPYDTIEAQASDGRSSFNISQIENVDLVAGAGSHALAASRYRDWRAQGMLVQDDEPAFYVHEQTYQGDDGTSRRRLGLLTRVRLADWSERIILPHERTFPGPRQERLERLRSVQANLSPLYLLYHDETGAIPNLLTTTLATTAPVAGGIDARGGEHRLMRLSEPGRVAEVRRLFDGERLFVADGHHRYEAALAYRDEQRRAGAGDDATSEFVLAMLADSDDPGVQVRPTHRVIRGLTGLDRRWFRSELDNLFDVDADPASPLRAEAALICTIVLPGETAPLRVYRRADAAHERLLPADRSPAWRELDVAIGDSVTLNAVLGVDPARQSERVIFTHDAATARQMVKHGDADLALLYATPSIPALARVAAAGDTLPPKSTYFDPKPPAGLVINDLGS